jgi:hypothetical protein
VRNILIFLKTDKLFYLSNLLVHHAFSTWIANGSAGWKEHSSRRRNLQSFGSSVEEKQVNNICWICSHLFSTLWKRCIQSGDDHQSLTLR